MCVKQREHCWSLQAIATGTGQTWTSDGHTQTHTHRGWPKLSVDRRFDIKLIQQSLMRVTTQTKIHTYSQIFNKPILFEGQGKHVSKTPKCWNTPCFLNVETLNNQTRLQHSPLLWHLMCALTVRTPIWHQTMPKQGWTKPSQHNIKPYSLLAVFNVDPELWNKVIMKTFSVHFSSLVHLSAVDPYRQYVPNNPSSAILG